MRIYEEEENQGKSWSLKLERSDYDGRRAMLLAVDSETGEKICNLLVFSNTGNVERDVIVDKLLRQKGYDPHEHGNKFDGHGRIIIKDVG